MSEVAVGIDIGTTYTKGVAITEDGTVAAVYRKPTPHIRIDSSLDLQSASTWWKCVKDVMRGLLIDHSHYRMRVKSICISAIAPTLTVFDTANPDQAFAILYSSLAVVDGSSLSQSDPELTKRRLNVLRNIAFRQNFVRPCITDLVGYVNWRLTDNLTINGLSLAEMGMTHDWGSCELFGVIDNITPQLVAAGNQIGVTTPWTAGELGIESGIPVSGGCPDTMSSVVGAGLTRASEKMLYLGTFGSILSLGENVNTLLNETSWSNFPFRWLLSIPGLGPEIELLSDQWFKSTTASDRLQILDQTAVEASPGADGTLFLVPRWKNGMKPVGRYEIVPDRSGKIGNVQRQSRAVLESIAYAALILGVLSDNSIKASGGGARSRIWLDIISAVLGCSIQTRDMAWEATGAADIAARLVWNLTLPNRPCYESQINTNVSKDIINDNYHRVMEAYHEYEWL